MENKATRNFVRSYLPWILAAVMLFFYFITLNKHVSLSSVLPVARATGLDWHPVFAAPLTWLATLPVRWLPADAQLIGLNLISALCAAATLWLLARSVALLPQDRTHEQRLREKSEDGLLTTATAWIPPAFAVLLLGLQRTFWENAIVNTGEIVDVLLIAYVVRCLLEFRVSQRDSWLYKLAFVYGLGIANNFAFIPYAAVVLVAIVWVKALRFFQFAFVLRLLAFGLAGLLLYFLLPIVQSVNDVASISFFQALRYNLGFQKQYLLGVHRFYAFWLGGFPLILILVASIRWSSGFGDSSRIGSVVGTLMAHLLHVGLLTFAVWMMLDLVMSPRYVSQKVPDVFGLAFLGSYYLTALAAGYFTGYLLLIFSDYSARSRRPGAAAMVPLSYAVTVLVCTAAVVAPVKLLMNNWPRIRAINAPEFKEFAQHQLASLPTQPTTVLSDDLARLYALTLVGGAKAGHVLIEGSSLSEPGYLKFLQKKYPALLPPLPREATNSPMPFDVLLNLLKALKQKHGVHYLNSSFGMYFETFYLAPEQLVFRLENYPSNAIEAPVPTPEIIARQGDFWNKLSTSTLRSLEARRAKITPDPATTEYDLLVTTRYYSQAMNYWGVELQRAGRFDEAAKYFDESLALNPDNSAAFINRESNLAWRKTGKPLQRLSEQALGKLKFESGGFEGLLRNNGPVDEPAFRFEMAQFFAQNRLWRQAAQFTLRTLSYTPNEPVVQNFLANVYLHSGQPERTLNVIKTIRTSRTGATTPPEVAVETIRTEAAAHFAQNDFTTAEKLLKDAVIRYPEQNGSFEGLSSFYGTRSEVLRREGKTAEADASLSNSLRVIEQQVEQQPQNPAAHFNLGNRCLAVKNFDCAVRAFTRVLELDPQNKAALINRGIVNLQAGRLDTAQADYEKLLEITKTEFRVYFGLAEIAYRKKNWDAARQNYEKYLEYAPADSAESSFVRSRLAEVKKR
jgi:tetratricopeptide (TPR) repeat protein